MIKFLVMDVDGTLTDGKIYMGADGEAFKAFDIKDGYGIKEVLPRYGIVPIVITARESKAVVNRCNELGITEVYQGIWDKISCLKRILTLYCTEERQYTLQNVAYIGDDLSDLQCMVSIKEMGGLTGCPSDAVEEVRQVVDYISNKSGGAGAVRDYINWLMKQYKSSSGAGETSGRKWQ